VAAFKQLPLKLGAALGAIAFLLPYVLVTIATYYVYEQSPAAFVQQADIGSEMSQLDVSAELFFLVLESGPGALIIGIAEQIAGANLANVDPADYPTVEDELGPTLDLLANNPEVPLLLVFIIAPYILFISSRYLARNYAPSNDLIDNVSAGATVTTGTFVIGLIIALVFPVTSVGSRIIVAGILVPALIGAFGGVTVWAYGDKSTLVSSLVGWGTIAGGILASALVLPLNLSGDVDVTLSVLERLIVGLGAYLNVIQFNVSTAGKGRLLFLILAVLTIGAGFARTYYVRNKVSDRMDGARIGSGIFLGFVTTIALFLWLFPMSTVLVENLTMTAPFGGGNAISQAGASLPLFVGSEPASIVAVGSFTQFVNAVLIGGIAFPMTFGGIGGYLAILYRDR